MHVLVYVLCVATLLRPEFGPRAGLFNVIVLGNYSHNQVLFMYQHFRGNAESGAKVVQYNDESAKEAHCEQKYEYQQYKQALTR